MLTENAEVLTANIADSVQAVLQYSTDDIYILILNIGLVVCFALGIIAGGQR